jgi:proteasome assembly chaperone (PAC2) family protein
MMDPKGAKAVLDGAAVNSVNVITVEMKDLMEKDRNKLEPEMQCDIEEVMAKKRDTRFHASRRPGEEFLGKGIQQRLQDQ